MVSTEKAMRGFVRYLDNELITMLPAKGWKRVVCGTAVAMAAKNAGNLVEILKTNKYLIAIGVFNTEGAIAIEDVKNEFVKQLGSEGMVIEIPIIGPVTFYQSDVEKLYEYIVSS